MSDYKKIQSLYQVNTHLFFEEEMVLSYQPGGYHPVSLGDTFNNGRYKIYHKLGFGGFSTVWLAKDNKLKQWVSLKIMRADQTNQSRELPTLSALTKHAKNVRGSGHIVTLLDDFLHKGPNGCHQCLVFELLGPTIDIMAHDDTRHPMEIFKITLCLLNSVALIHKAGFAHGDLSPRNLAYYRGLSTLSEDDMFRLLGPIRSDEILRRDGASLESGVPTHIIGSANWLGWPPKVSDADEIDIRVLDFGEAFYYNAVPKTLAQPREMQAPETIFTDDFDHRVDLWAVGLIIYFLVFNYLPILCLEDINQVECMISLSGELPLEWQPKWEQMLLNNKGQFRMHNLIPGSDLAESFADISDPDLKILLPVIKGLTRLLPSDRMSASEAIEVITEGLVANGRADPMLFLASGKLEGFHELVLLRSTTMETCIFDAPTPGGYVDTECPEASSTEITCPPIDLSPADGGNGTDGKPKLSIMTSTSAISASVVANLGKNVLRGLPKHQPLDKTYTPVPADPFEFFQLPVIPRLITLELYLDANAKRYAGGKWGCDCTRIESSGWRHREIEPEDLCYNLHRQFGYHAKFLPLLLTNRQMHDEFRAVRYKHGTFYVIPIQKLRDGPYGDFDPPCDGPDDLMSTYITPYPENLAGRTRRTSPAPLLRLGMAPPAIWNAIQVVKMNVFMSFPGDKDIVKSELGAFVDAISKRERPLRKLTVKLSWGRPWETEQEKIDASWKEVVAPLRNVQAREILFVGRDFWDGDADVDAGEDDNGEQRTFKCDHFEDFEAGLEVANDKGQLDVEYWHCGC